MEAAKRDWSFHDDAIIMRFVDFLSDNGKYIDDPDADEMFEVFLAAQGDDSYVYWESYWNAPTGVTGGTHGSST